LELTEDLSNPQVGIYVPLDLGRQQLTSTTLDLEATARRSQQLKNMVLIRSDGQ
jgi:hypothetical protein